MRKPNCRTTCSVPSPTPIFAVGDERHTAETALALAKSSTEFSETELGRLRSSARAASKVLGVKIEMLPLNPLRLRPLLRAAVPQDHRINRKRWLNIKSDMRKLGILAGLMDGPHKTLSESWLGLFRQIPSDKHRRLGIAAFVRYCSRLGIEPIAVSSDTLASFADYLHKKSLHQQVRQVVWRAADNWNHFAAEIVGWPAQRLKAPVCAHRVSLPIDSFPTSFGEDVERYLKSHSGNALFVGDNVARPLSPHTIAHRRQIILISAAHLVQSGKPASAITGLSSLVGPDEFRAILTIMHERADKKVTIRLKTFAGTLIGIAEAHCGLSGAELEQLRRYYKQLRVSKVGLSDRILDRLRRFDAPELRQRFLQLPDTIANEAERLRLQVPIYAARLHEQALALDILISTGVRRRNLDNIDINKHLLRDSKELPKTIHIPAAETKNARAITWNIPTRTAHLFDRHLEAFRPLLSYPPSPWLFPGPDPRKPRCPETLARSISKLVTTRLGIPFHCHLVRHLIGTMLMDDDPRNLPVVKEVLNHVYSKTTERMYGQQRNRSGLKFWSSHLEKRINKASAQAHGKLATRPVRSR